MEAVSSGPTILSNCRQFDLRVFRVAIFAVQAWLATHPSSTHRRMSCTRRSPVSALAARGQLDIPPRFSSGPPCLLSCCLREARIYLVNSESLMEEPDLGRLLWNLALTEKTKGGRMGTQPGRSQLRGQGRRSLPPGPHGHSPHQALNGLEPPQPPPDASSTLFPRFPNKWQNLSHCFNLPAFNLVS